MKLFYLAFAGVLYLASFAGDAFAQSSDTLTIQLKDGPVVVQLMPDVAPKHVAQIEALAKKGAYDNVAFHRVIEGFMAQTGDVKFGNMEKGFDASLAGTGGSDLPDLPAEFSKTPFVRGTVGMARSQDRTRPTRSFSSCSLMDPSSTASIPSSARSFPAWRTSTRSSAAKARTAKSAIPTG